VRKGDAECIFWMAWMNRLQWREVLASVAVGLCVTYLGGVGLGVSSSILFFLGLEHRLQRKRLDDAFEFQQKSLEDMRKLVLLQEELSQSLIEAQKSSHEMIQLAQLGEISHSYVHDLASPMSVVQFCTEWMMSSLKEGDFTPEQLEKNTKRIQKAVKTMQQMNVLWRKMGQAGQERKWIRGRADQQVKDIADLFEAAFQKYEIEFQLRIDSGCETEVSLLENGIAQILINLIQNSIKALSDVNDRKRRLELSLSVIQGKEPRFRIGLLDYGPGIPEDRKAKLFERFGTTTSSHGTGFGMYAVQKVVHEMKGSIELHSIPGKTEWEITFPLVK
jgi:signal transduction histidine kinase